VSRPANSAPTIEIIVSVTQSTDLAIMKSAGSGKAGGLRERDPLKAVVVGHEATKAPPAPVVRGVCLFVLVVFMIFKFCIASGSSAD
jgi:hypothetical protein